MDVLHTDDPVHLTYAIEDNGAEFLLQLGRAGGGEERKAPAHWIIGGSPIDYHNAVVAAMLNSDTAADTVAESIAVMRRHRVPGCWHVGPSMNPPPDLGEILVEHGFTYAGDDIGMAADL